VTGVLVTGFEPFGEHAVNPSALVAKSFDGVVLPVSYARAAGALRAAIDDADPDVVLCFGLADNRTKVSVERFAHNLDEASTTDNDAASGSGRRSIRPDRSRSGRHSRSTTSWRRSTRRAYRRRCRATPAASSATTSSTC